MTTRPTMMIHKARNNTKRRFGVSVLPSQAKRGFVLWVELPETVNALDLHRQALKHQISIAPGPIFSATGQYPNFIRLNGGYPWSDRIEQALETLGRLAGRSSKT